MFSSPRIGDLRQLFAIMLRPFGFLVPKQLLNYLTFIYFDPIKDYSISTFLFTILPNMNVNLKPGAAARNKK